LSETDQGITTLYTGTKKKKLHNRYFNK